MKLQELKSLSESSWAFDRQKDPIFELSGPEHREWLERISSQKSIDLKNKEFCCSAFLTGGGGVIATFQLVILDGKTLLLAREQNAEKIEAYLEEAHFGEDLSFQKKYAKSFYEISKNNTFTIPETFLQIAAEPANLGGKICISFEEEFKVDKTISPSTYHALRNLAGYPLDPVDINEENIILEAPMQDYATDTKGCYPGQEVIAKVYTYGRVAKKLLPFFIEKKKGLEPSVGEDVFWFLDQVIEQKKEKAGKVKFLHDFEDGYLIYTEIKRVYIDRVEKAEGTFLINDSPLIKF